MLLTIASTLASNATRGDLHDWCRRPAYLRFPPPLQLNGPFFRFDRPPSASLQQLFAAVERQRPARQGRTIPRILHQTAKSCDLPHSARNWHARCESKLGSSWQHALWTDEDNMRLMERQFPAFWGMYQRYNMDIKRADAARYFILYLYGGIYMDTDFTCLRDLTPLLEASAGDVVLGIRGKNISGRTGPRSTINFSASFEVPNAFMAAPPGHPFIAFVIGHLRALEALSVLRSTGPSMLTGALKAWQDRGLEQVQLLPGSALYPDCGRGTPSDIRNCTLQWPDAWAATFWTKSWIHTKYHRIAFVDDSGECIRDDPFASRRCEVGKGKAQGGGKGDSRAHAARGHNPIDEARHTSATEPPMVAAARVRTASEPAQENFEPALGRFGLL